MRRSYLKMVGLIFISAIVITACSSETESSNISSINEADVKSESVSQKTETSITPSRVNPFEEYKDYPINSKEYMYYYVNNGIPDFPDLSSQLVKLEQDWKNAEKQEIYVYENIWGSAGFKKSNSAGNYKYIGELKNGEPNGVGMIVYDISLPGVKVYQRLYEGYFKDGVYNGFGVEYIAANSKGDATIGRLVEDAEDIINDGNYESYINWYYNPISFIGIHDKNGRSEMGIEFCFPDEKLAYDLERGMSFLNYSIRVGQYQKNKLIEGKEYVHEHLLYEGGFANDKRDGKGKLYYRNSDSLAFDGEFKNGEARIGTMYAPDGAVIASGEWKNGLNGVIDFEETYWGYCELTDLDYRELLGEDYDYSILREVYLQEQSEKEFGGNYNQQLPEEIVTNTYPDDSRYILPDSSSRYLNESDLYGLGSEILRLARNEIFARHGRIFQSEDLNIYFSAQSWYNGYLSAEEFDDSVLNEYEKANLELIKAVENGTNITDGGLTLRDVSNIVYSTSYTGEYCIAIGEYSDNGQIYASILKNNDDIWRGELYQYQTLEYGGIELLFSGNDYVSGEKSNLQVRWNSIEEMDFPTVTCDTNTKLNGSYSFSNMLQMP